jgi:phosphatidylglycerophosphatase A
MSQNTTFSQRSAANRDLPWWISTLCGLGFLTKAPGTLASVVAFFIYGFFPVPLYAIAAVFALGVWSSWKYCDRRGVEDPGEVVIDEVVGMWIAMYGHGGGFLLPALFLFRIVDIIKPFPVNLSERLPGGLGVMADDAVGGFLVNLILIGIHWLYYGGGWSAIL